MNEGKSTADEAGERAVDWNEVHRRMEATRAAIEGGWTPTPEAKKRILRARAQALAQAPPKREISETDLEVVEFTLAHEVYGVEAAYVREIHPLRDLTPLPCTPPFVLGLVNVRGQILTVIDIKKFFGLPEKGLTDLNKVILLYSEGLEFGVLADAILGVRRVAPSKLQPSLPTLTGIREEFLKGVTPERVVILDAGKLLSKSNLVVHEEVEA